MKFIVKVRVNVATVMQFGQALQAGQLDRSCVRGETYCTKDDPAVGYSIWETASSEEFEKKFGPWRHYYEQVEVLEVISPAEAMKMLFSPGEEKTASN